MRVNNFFGSALWRFTGYSDTNPMLRDLTTC